MPQFPEFPGDHAVVSDFSDRRGMVRVTGADRIAFLTRIMSGDLPPTPGAARTALLGPKGNLIAAAVATVTREAVLLECERVREQMLLAALDRYRITDDVDLSLADRSDFEIVCTDAAPTPERPDLAPPGWVLETAVGFLRRDFRPWSATTIFHAGIQREDRVSFREHILDDGEAVEATPEEQEYLRILAGEPRWEAELDERSLPLQSGLASHVRLGRGCYIGQEYVARQAHRGRIPRLLRRLDFGGGGVPEVGAEVLSGGAAAGRITSAARRPVGWDGPAAVALAVVSANASPGASVEVAPGLRAVVAEI